MAFEIKAQFTEQMWLSQNSGSVKALIQSLPSYVSEPQNGVYWLKSHDSSSQWVFDIRIFNQNNELLIEVSSFTDAYYSDIVTLVNGIKAQTPITLVDDDEEPVSIV